MKLPLQLVFIGMEPSAAVESAAREKVAKLDRFHPDLMSCRVTIELLGRHKQQGRQFAVRIDLTMQGAELAVDRVQHEDVYVALRDAFDDMKRRVQDRVRRLQDHTLPPAAGRVEPLGELERSETLDQHGLHRSRA